MTIQVPEVTPASVLPGQIGTTPLSTVYIEGIPSDLAAPASQVSTQADSQRFWSSQPRMPGDPSPDSLVISLSRQRLVNYITMDLAHFPHTMSVSWWDGLAWQPALSAAGSSPLTYAITGSIPSAVNNAAALQAGLNPYHFGAGHWVHQDDMIQPVTTDRLLLQAVRGTLSQGPYPYTTPGILAAYPVGVRNLDFGYRVRSVGDVPWTPRSADALTEREPFTTSVDVHGSPVTVSLRENRASNLLQGKPWKCAPQVRRDAVVGLYVDSRASSGAAQVIDRFYVNPVTSGVRFNLYYSPDPPPPGASFQAVDTPLVFPAVAAGGVQLPSADGNGILFPAAGGWVQVANQAIGATSSQPWWGAGEFVPQFGSGDLSNHMILDAGLVKFYYSLADAFVLTVNDAVVGSWNAAFSPGTAMQFAVGYDGSRIFGWMPGGAMYMAHTGASLANAITALRFGDVQAGTSEPGNYRLTALTVKQEQVDLSAGVPAEFTAFARDPGTFTAPAGGTGPTTLNAITRFSPSFILGEPGTGINPYGFVGGPGSSYEACTWIPVMRDFRLARGFVEFSPVLASVFKFEFTHLQPQHYDFLGSYPQTIRRLPQLPLGQQPRPRHPGNDSPAVDNGLVVNQGIAATVAFQDTPTPTPDPAPGSTLPTEALYATDPVAASALAQQAGSMYNFQPWQPETTVSRIPTAQVHSYEEAVIPQLSRVAYFVSVSSLGMYRAEFTAQDDTEEYVDNFDDTHNISQSSLASFVPGIVPWSWSQGMLSSPGAFPALASFARVNSNVFSSGSPVRGIQFATTESEPVQLLPDPSFSDPALGTWTNAGDSPPLVIANINSQLGNMIQVTRVPGTYGWSALEQLYPIWSALQSALPTWGALQANNSTSAFGGFAYDGPPVVTTRAGRVYAAARVFATQALNAPLALQILDGATGVVVAESDQPVQGGIVTEWYVGYTIGSVVITSPPWSTVQASHATWAGFAGTTWGQADTTNPALGGTLSARVIQKGATSDTWYADDLSIFENSIIWEFSSDAGASWWPAYEIRNNPSGVMIFPPPAKGTGNQLMWRVSGYRPNLAVSSLAIRPWYSMHPMGTPPRSMGVGHGPNAVPADQYGPVEDDPRWQAWDLPVPQEWFFIQKQILGLGSTTFVPPQLPSAPAPPDVNLAFGVISIVPPAVTPAEPSTYEDTYPDAYEDFYGLADGSDFYTDAYSDLYDYSSANITGTQWSASAAFTAAGTLTATATHISTFRPSAGASVGNVAGDANAVDFFIQRTGQPMRVRRLFFGNSIPATLDASLAAKDAQAGRRVCIDIRPDSTTTPGQFESFLASCQQEGLDAEFTIWHGPDQHFSGVREYLVILAQYVPLIRRYGYKHIFSVSNSSVLNDNVLAEWYPGDAFTDGISAELYPISFNPSAIKPTDFAGMTGVTLNLIGNFADVHGQRLGITQMGIDRGLFSVSQGNDFLEYVDRFFSARKKAGKPNGDVIYDSTTVFDLTGGPQQWVNLYNQIGRDL
jgi:hypothetical protein